MSDTTRADAEMYMNGDGDWCVRVENFRQLERDLAAANERERRDKEGRCEHCGTKIIDRCYVCGAPQCCPLCCAKDENDRLRAELQAANERADATESALSDCQVRLSRRVQEVERLTRERGEAVAVINERLVGLDRDLVLKQYPTGWAGRAFTFLARIGRA